VDVIGFKLTVTMAWAWSSHSCLGKPWHEMSPGISVRVWVRSLPAQQEFCLRKGLWLMAAWLPDVWALDVHVCTQTFIKRLWISDG